MKSLKIFSIALLAAATLLTAGCKKKEILEFGGQMDQFSATDENGSKTYLGHAEQWIYWETGDKIKVFDGSNAVPCELVSGARTLDAYFRSESTLNVDAKKFWAIYPSTSYGSSYTDLIFPATQTYRENSDATHPDSSFGRGALPMVAYDATGMAHQGTIYFHVVAGILRVQILSNTTKTIDQITFKEVGSEHGSSNKQISGHFNVQDINQNQPYLTGTTVTDESRTIVINNINKEVGPTKLLTFYLPLPAVTSASAVTNYILRMTVKTTDNKYFTRDFNADIHRRNITMMRALEVTTWSTSADGSGSLSDIRLVGSGTKDRPFQIYSGKELAQLRDVYNNGGTINGQTIRGYSESSKEEPTYVKIVRSDIVLLNNDDYNALPAAERDNPSSRYVYWHTGIQNFRGYMYFASSTATNGGISNQSDKPLFESIATDGYVYRVYVKGTCTPMLFSGSTFSPMCHTNNGTMKECHNKCVVTTETENANLAGLCVINAGSIIGGANEAQLTSTNGNVAGICYTNNSMIQGNFTLSVAVPQGKNIAGITYNNNANVKDCQVSSNTAITSTGNWGVIAFNNNSAGVIDNCTSTGTVVYTIDGSVGGICNVNDGTVKNCTNGVEIRASSGNVGGIVATMDNANAVVYNSCTRAPFLNGALDAVRVADNIGGVVGYLGAGKVYNCYNASLVSGATNSGGMIGFLANNAAADVQNCWSAQGQSFVGLYENATEHHVGPFCFSATVAAAYCNRIANATITVNEVEYHPYEIITMHADQTLGGTVTPSSFIGQHCGVALNAWVTAHQDEGGRHYYEWTTPAGARPVFNTGMPGGGKKGRSRR